jgi:hypothetical protein|tara:strand:+ start:122 stop:499 length:378 start_codon:yes stop_codon:yes gene_type:complete
MMKGILRLTALSFIWTRYKTGIVSTAILFLYFWLVGELHQDFVEFAALNDDAKYLGVSFLVKWLGFVLGVVVYFLLSGRYRNQRRGGASSPDLCDQPGDDPFDAIRKKENLRSAADFVVDKDEKG